MTKKTVSQELDEIATSAPDESIEDKMYDRSRAEMREAQWVRETALRCAIDFHKNNGGMTTASALVDQAQTFLNFIQGETK